MSRHKQKPEKRRHLKRTNTGEQDRCPQPCGKKRFEDAASAKLHCMVMASQGILQVWYGSRECDVYHVTSNVDDRRGLVAKREQEMRLLMGTRTTPHQGSEAA